MENKNIILNIGRQIGSGGHIIATQLATCFGYQLYDREVLNLAAKESGFSKKFFEQNDEKTGFFRTLFHANVPLIGENNFYKNDLSQESLYQFQSDAILKAAAEGNCIFVGRTADYILREHKNRLDIFVTADLNDRIARVMERRNCNEEAAHKFITAKEEARATYYNYYTGKRWGAANSYDLCVNSSRLGLEETANFIAAFVRQRFNL